MQGESLFCADADAARVGGSLDPARLEQSGAAPGARVAPGGVGA
jgi:hypothetical protein